MNIGCIGTGVMGSGIVRNLIKEGYAVTVYNRTASKAAPLVTIGASIAPDIATLASECDVIMTIVGYPSDVEAIYFDEHGLLNRANPGTLLIDMTTSSPALAKRIGDAATARGLSALDAPVSGGDIGAQNGTLSIMVGGEERDVERAMPIFRTIGTSIHHHGPHGSGQHAKMSNQIAVTGTMIAVCEALLYAKRTGLDVHKTIDTIAPGAAGSWTMSHLAPRIVQGDTAPGFYVKHFVKDMKIAQRVARDLQFKTPGLDLALSLYEQIEAEGLGDEGTQVLYEWLSRQS